MKNFFEFFFAWNVLNHKEIPKNSRNSTFFSKLKFPPVFEKHLKNFQDQKPMVYAINFSKSQRGKIQTPVHSVYWKGWKKNDHSVNRSVYWTNDIHYSQVSAEKTHHHKKSYSAQLLTAAERCKKGLNTLLHFMWFYF